MENIDQPSRRLLGLLLGAASIFIIIWGIRSSAYIINPILMAAVITITVLPLPGKLKQRGLPGWLSLVVTIVVVVGGLLVVLLFSAYAIGKVAAEIPSYTASTTEQQIQPGNATGPLLDSLELILEEILRPQQIASITATIVTIVGKSVFQVFIVLLIFGFMLSAAIALPRISRLGLDPDQPALGRVAKFTAEVRQYVLIMTLVNFLVGMGNTILLWIIGVDFALLWGILAWALGYIPSVGFWLAMIPPLILAYAEFGAGTALIVFLAYVLINGGVQNLLQPRLMGQSLKISPLVVFISVFVWAWLLGGLGAILAVPLTLIILEVLDTFPTTRWLVTLLRFTPEQETEDKQEARARLRQFWDRMRPGAHDQERASEP